jgi:disease resistance protein RPS2
VVEKLKEIEVLLKAGSSYFSVVAVKHSTPRAVEHIPGPTIQDQTTALKVLDKTMTLLSDEEVRRIGIWGMED